MTESKQAGPPAAITQIAAPEDAATRSGAPQEVFLSTAAARQWDRRLAAAFVLVSIVGLAVAAPFASHRWPVTPSFIAAYGAALTVNDLITAILLVGQFKQMRRVAVLIIGCGYLFDTLLAAAHALSFPDVFSVTGLLGGSRQTTPWIFILWHGMFPLFICAYALVVGSTWDAPLTERGARKAVAIGIAGVCAAVALCVLAATVGVDWLPEVINGNNYHLIVTSGIAPAILLVSLMALFVLWLRTRGRTVLDLWLTVVMAAWVLDIFLTTIISAVRYDFGWYAGRMYALAAASFVLGVLLLEANQLYRRLARALDEAKEKNAELLAAVHELDAFSYSVSHDLRTPLRAIDGFSRILLKHHASELAPEPREYLQAVRDNTAQMGHLVDDLLAFARLNRAQIGKREVPTRSIVEQVVGEVRQQAEGRSVNVTVGDLPAVWGDAALLRQVFVNLIDNAFKYTRPRQDAAVEIGTCDIGGERVFFVRDNGVGFDMQYADKLFDVFQRLHRAEDFEGTGVGLAIAQRIVHRHGGRIWAEAAVNQGAAFYFTTEVPNHA